jgi:hypothetical protein
MIIVSVLDGFEWGCVGRPNPYLQFEGMELAYPALPRLRRGKSKPVQHFYWSLAAAAKSCARCHRVERKLAHFGFEVRHHLVG